MARILVIDDSEKDREITARILGEKHEVLTADSWSTAFPVLTKEPLDLILIDVILAGFQGDEVARLVSKSLESHQGPSPKIVLFSSMDKSALKLKARQAGADGHIHKTFQSATLLRKVNEVLIAGKE